MSRRRVRWVSGAASAVAAMLDWREHPGEGVFATCETNSEDPDNERFLRDVEAWLGQEIIRLRSEEYVDTWDVWERRRYLSGPNGAPCTRILKMEPRLTFQRPDDIHIFGYDNGPRDRARAENLRESFFDLTIVTPLIDRGLDKQACLALLERAGVAPPLTYALGFEHANCMPCVKATSPGYWALVRKVRPEAFERMAELSRRLGARLVILRREKGQDGKLRNIRGFIDEIPLDQPTTDAFAPACDFICQISGQDLE